MISVIIPTMWKAEHLKRMLPMLDAHPLIGEIILIDNDRLKTDHELLKNISKLVYWTFEEINIFVNPSWNHGAKVAKFDKLFILNDDCIVNLTPLQTIYDAITPDKGLIGFSKLSYCSFNIDAYDTLSSSGFGVEVTINPVDPRMHPNFSGMPHVSYGSAFFVHKESFQPIPNDFLIYYGDLYMYLKNLKEGKHNYVIEEGLVVTQMSTTVDTIPREQIVHEANILKEKFAEYGLKGIKYQIPKI